jgi:hypothetical protein
MDPYGTARTYKNEHDHSLLRTSYLPDDPTTSLGGATSRWNAASNLSFPVFVYRLSMSSAIAVCTGTSTHTKENQTDRQTRSGHMQGAVGTLSVCGPQHSRDKPDGGQGR